MPSKVKALSLAVLLGLSGSVWAGLGTIKVNSRLNEPFYAVIPLTGQTAKDAAEPSLSSQQDSVKFSIQGSSSSNRLDFRVVRKNKQAYVQVRSSMPIQDPILTFSVKVFSASGTVARQYSAILDPRGYNPPSNNSGYVPNRGSGVKEPTVKGSRPASRGRTVYVQENDTLTSIAARFKPARMSLANVKRAIFLANRKAFINGNPSLIKKGATIQVPTEARMRSLLAKSAPKRKRTVTRPNSAGVSAAPVVTENKDLASLQRELTQAKERIAKLEKELENAKKNAGTSNVTTPPPVEVEKPPVETVVDVPVSTPNVDTPTPTDASNNETVSGIDETVSELIITDISDSEVSENEVPEEASETPPIVRPPIVRPPIVEDPIPEPSFLDGLLDDPVMLGAGAGGLLLILGGLFYIIKKRRKGSDAIDDDDDFDGGDTFFSMSPDDTEAGGLLDKPNAGGVKTPVVAAPNIASPSRPAPAKNSGGNPSSGGDAASTFMSDFTRMSAAIDSVEIDPLSEAEVYIAYGRTDEAEEILADALAKDPAQHEVRKKLLEIYAGKQDVATFNSMAKELYNAFDGRGALWQDVAAMGAKLDPSNPMYLEKGASNAVAPSAPVVNAVEVPLEEDTNVDLDFSGFGDDIAEESNEQESNLLAFDSPVATVENSSVSVNEVEDNPFAMDFPSLEENVSDLTTNAPQDFSGLDISGVESDNGNGLAFDLDAVLSDAQESGSLDTSAQTIDFSGSDGSLSDLADLDNMNFGMDSSDNMFSLDDAPLTDNTQSSENDPLAAKLELARVYLDMGDADGAKEALIELLEETQNPTLRAEATQMLGNINS